nr:tRNA (adenosine(37)-N6)-threonylcarbamoyltransferase complex ATPase subunit type 1 TsaE [Nakamurella panacisegetis]
MRSTEGTTVRLDTLEDTLRFGRSLGAMLRAGDLVILSGSLGAGKTALTKGIGAGMGVTGTIASPTFVLVRVHPAGPDGVQLVHVDAYRLAGAVELDDLDLDTDLTASAVVIEWGEGVAEQLADARLTIHLDRRPDDTRLATLTAVGDDWTPRMAALSAADSQSD